MRQEMKKSRAVVTLLVTIAITAILLFTSAVGWGADGAGSAKDIKLGLDLAGGVSITYQAVGDEAPSVEDMADTVYKLQKATVLRLRFTRKVPTVSILRFRVSVMQMPFWQSLENQVLCSSRLLMER